MSGQAWTWLTPRALMPQPERLSQPSRAHRAKPEAGNEKAVDLWHKGLTSYGKSTGEGGGSRLTSDDVRHALGGLPPKPFRFGMAAFLGDAQSLRMVETFLVTEIRWHADAGGWLENRSQAETIERLASLMIFEAISARSRHETYSHEDGLPEGSAAVRCPQCLGRGVYVSRTRVGGRMEYGHAQPCDLCRGGVFVLDQTSRARLAGVSLKWWRSTWSQRYAELISIPYRWEEQAIWHVRRRLRLDGA